MCNTLHWQMARNPAAAPTHQSRFDEKVRKNHGPDWIGVQVTERFPRLSEAKIKEGVWWVLRPQALQTCSSTNFRATR
jgi:hypothetical protein